MKLIFAIVILLVDFFVTAIFSEFGSLVKDSAFWTNMVFSFIMLAAISFIFLSDEQGRYVKIGDKNQKIDDFVSSVFGYYNNIRKRHLFIWHLRASMLVRRAKGEPETFNYLFKTDIALYDHLNNAVEKIKKEFSITKDDTSEIIKIIKLHQSVIRERNGFLKIFAVLVLSLFSLRNIAFFKPIFALITFKVGFFLVGCLAIFERQSIIKYAAIYDEIMTVLKEDP